MIVGVVDDYYERVRETLRYLREPTPLAEIVPDEFQQAVRRELEGCRRRLLDLPDRAPRRDRGRTHRYRKGRCVECGVPHDETTAGCNFCRERHRARRRARDRLAVRNNL
jgi:hypothetical protein